jgi:eukaryotic-like serine/threonine-protein kinase
MSTDYPSDPAYDGASGTEASRYRIGLSMLDAFREEWSRGHRVSAEEFARQHAAVTDDEILLDVVFAEYVARQEVGEHPTLDEYVRRFPHLGERLTRLLALDEAIRDVPGLEEALEAAETHDPQAAETLAAPRRPAKVVEETTRIGKYLILGELGSGGQGKVYRAVHPSLAREVVIKISHVRVGVSAHLRDELVREGRLLAELDHPNLARVHDFDFHDGEPFLVMEYLPGANLEQHARQAMLSPAVAATLTAKIARAVAAIHKKGVVHRDLKPRNIMIDAAGEPRLIDFGLAIANSPWRYSESGNETIVGTLAYMAPEQAAGEGDRVGPAADLFALGGILYFLLTGKPPFKGRGFEDTLLKVAANDHDRSSLEAAKAPESLKAICRKLLSTKPVDRFASADEAATALERDAAGKPRRSRWRPLALTAAAVVLVGLAIAGAFRYWPSNSGIVTPAQVHGPTARPEVNVDLWNPKTKLFRPIKDALGSGDVCKVRIRVPAGVHVSLFRVDGAMKLEHEVDVPPQARATTIDHPSAAGKGIQANGPTGTEMYLAIASRKGPVTADEFRDLLAGPAWPKLEAGSLLRLTMEEVAIQDSHRGVNIIDIGPDPEEHVKARLEALRLGLIDKHFDGFDGYVFAHVE